MIIESNNKFDFPSNLSDIWRLLNDCEHKLLRENSIVQHYKRNQLIYSEGTSPIYLMCLLKGKVKIYKDGIYGRKQILRVIKPIQYFAYRAYFAGENYLTSSSSFEPSIVCLIPMKVVQQIMRNNHNLCVFFIRQLSIDLGNADERVVNLTQKHLRGRLSETLLSLIKNYGLDTDSSINIYLSREDLANMSNMTTSNAIRTLSAFANEKIVAVDGRKIKLLNEEKLRRISRIG
ncbi:Crp/Fnr family transcriptional regulator [Candidatus Azobacteroides pseudotrichonymphae]|jgi:CRP-like cAMP-binding protein|uniref:Global nitrogen regulator NtcA n=1 Tax=Azobacteroides pseudotrichonymphae genomovar. CFP2 TaxID=511995 RepID=B6YRI0_AZOPC|nr:Crp/Fnr family transcriptional regulator [Candidatus Azobacteroides pseudotrichonymphae]MDR0530195.1 Crp/Fnr family transcriptional regulator [Bacteroidales bacterium OttesenSCG-928-I14]BAG83802.1 global nitrogen regulator NtcA [Candidatus Azobacteroides pseudotrichonymphae genomovar. CFP2]